jgi:membrane-associated phospholipid phosphatase
MALFFYGYFALARFPANPVLSMPISALDSVIPFQGIWFYAYASLWVYTSLVPALIGTVYKLMEYTVFIALLCLLGFATFYFLPTTVPYHMGMWGNDPAMRALQSVDLAGNAFPSLHVASAVFSALCLHRLLKELVAPKAIHLINIVWCCLIVYSTLAIKQHVVWDVLGGMVLAMLVNTIYGMHMRQIHR